MTMNDFKQGMGFHSMWGLSPSFDLLLLLLYRMTGKGTAVASVAAKQEEINILLVHPGDARHVVHTLGRHGCRRHCQQHQQQQHVNIFILESEIEILARHILQMKIFLNDHIPIRHRASLYLELYNGLISERGYDYVNQAGKDLGEFVYGDDCNGNDGDDNCDDELSRLRHLVDLSWLKQKERDALYHVFHNEWCGSGSVSGSVSVSDTGGNGRSKVHHDKLQELNVELLRDYRLRGYYGDRYDCRHNLSEYDYYTRVKQTAGIIHVDQWRKWRMTGIAYEFGSNNVMYDKQNRTMMTSIKKSGIINQNVKGYWLDIINGPYISHGVEIDDDVDDDDLTAFLDVTHDNTDNTTKNIYARGLLEVLNQGTGAEQYRHHTVEVSMFNLINYMWGFETGTKYIMTKEHDIFSGLDTSSCHSNGRAMATTTTTTVKAQLVSQNNDQEQHRKERCNDWYDDAHANTKENMKRMTPISVTKAQRKLGLDGITIIPLLGDLDNVLSKKKKYQGRFDYVFLSQRVAHWLGSEKFKSILRLHSTIPDNNNNQEQDTTNTPTTTSSSFLDGNARVEVESGKFIFQLQEKDQIALYERIKTMAEMQGFDEIPLSSRKSSSSSGSSNTNTINNDVPWNKNTFLFQAR